MPEKPDLRRGSWDCIYPAPKSALWESRVGQRAVVWRVFGGVPCCLGSACLEVSAFVWIPSSVKNRGRPEALRIVSPPRRIIPLNPNAVIGNVNLSTWQLALARAVQLTQTRNLHFYSLVTPRETRGWKKHHFLPPSTPEQRCFCTLGELCVRLWRAHVSGNRGGNLSSMSVFVSMTKSAVNKPKAAQQRRLRFWCSVTNLHISETLMNCWRFQLPESETVKAFSIQILLNQNLKFWFHRPLNEIINDPNSKLHSHHHAGDTWGHFPHWAFRLFDDSAGETVWMLEISKPAQTAVMKFLTHETETFTFPHVLHLWLKLMLGLDYHTSPERVQRARSALWLCK